MLLLCDSCSLCMRRLHAGKDMPGSCQCRHQAWTDAKKVAQFLADGRKAWWGLEECLMRSETASGHSLGLYMHTPDHAKALMCSLTADGQISR